MTRPLLYASPDSLDLVLRLNSPRPPLSSGYTDIGAKLNFYPQSSYIFVPTEIDLYIVNGLGEVSNRLRTFPYTENLHVEPPPISGVNIDFGHLNNNLADNNNNKTPGGRIIFSRGAELKGVQLGISGMGGRYNLEAALPDGQDYTVIGADLLFWYRHFSLAAEYIDSKTDFRLPQSYNSLNQVNFDQDTSILPSKTESNKGYYIQAAFPIWTKPRFGEKVLGILALSHLERRGPELIFSTNLQPTNKLPVTAFAFSGKTINTSINKYTAGLNFKINKNLAFKTEYSYWDINVPPIEVGDPLHPVIVPQSDINQLGFSLVLSF